MVDKRLVRVTAEEAVSALSDRIAGVTGAPEAILRFTPANNVPVNGQAFLAVDSVEILPNAPAYHEGDEVARITLNVNGTTTAAEVLTQVVDDLFRVRVPAALRAKGVVMVLWRFDPQHPDATPEASWSMMPWSQLLTAVEEARAQHGQVNIVARSRVNANRFGPLDLSLDVQPAHSP